MLLVHRGLRTHGSKRSIPWLLSTLLFILNYLNLALLTVGSQTLTLDYGLCFGFDDSASILISGLLTLDWLIELLPAESSENVTPTRNDRSQETTVLTRFQTFPDSKFPLLLPGILIGC